ncbi:branched-subunit amino acid transport protein [Rhodoligotrophos appendicifer]|uniref:AzlD domain-containing protein n=1 Tax=Rhodoligotrophos appendicifer TaxID=987056 RepID=UPI001184827B|nr:AzlD domain-containing protein [Rhodoligotrophos appendicifer]
MTMSDWPIWLIVLLVGGLSTYVWRFLGAVLVSQVNPQGEFLLWVRAVATALVAALVWKLMLTPSGVLAETALSNRVIALAAGVAMFFLAKRNLPLSIAVSLGTLMAAEALHLRLL